MRSTSTTAQAGKPRPPRPVLAKPVKGRRSRERFPAALRGLMEERRLSYRQLAYKTHLSAGYLNHLTKGSRPVPADQVLESLAYALHVEPDFFLEYRLRKLADVLGEAPDLADALYGVLLCEVPVTPNLAELLEESAVEQAEDDQSNVVRL